MSDVFGELAKNKTPISSLLLEDMGLTDQHCVQLAPVLENHTSLTKISLSNNTVCFFISCFRIISFLEDRYLLLLYFKGITEVGGEKILSGLLCSTSILKAGLEGGFTDPFFFFSFFFFLSWTNFNQPITNEGVSMTEEQIAKAKEIVTKNVELNKQWS